MKHFRVPFRILAVLIVTAIARGLRARVVNLLPIDYDEDDYLRAGQEFAHLIRTSDWRGFPDTNYRPSIAIASIIAFLMACSEFAIGRPFVEKASTATLAMSIYAIVQTQYLGGAQPWSYLGSLAIIMSIPAILIFIIFQRTLLDRMMFGVSGE